MNSCLTSGCWGRKLHHCQVDWNDGTRNTLLALSLTDFCKLYVIAKGWNMNTKHAAIFILWLSIKVLTVSRWKFFATKPLSIPVVLRSFSTIRRFGPPPRIPHVLTWPKVGATSSASQLGPVKGWIYAKKKWTNFWIWVFPKPVVPPNHPLKNRVFHYKPSILGYHYFWKHPYVLSILGMFFGKVEDGNIQSCFCSVAILLWNHSLRQSNNKNGKQIIKCHVVPMSLFNILMYVI